MAENELLTRLVTMYSSEDIRHPQLRGVTLAQWLLESGRATSDLATKHYNFGGLKWRREMAGIATRVEYEAHDGVDVYCKFATIENFITGFWIFLNRSPYSGWEANAETPEKFIRFIGPIYAGDESYADKVLAILPEANRLLDEAVRVRTNGHESLHDDQTGGDDLGVIVIDPGHGGTQNMPGSDANHAISVSGVKEKKLALDFALILRGQIYAKAKSSERVKVIMTRETDKNLPGRERARFAFDHKAKLFLCLHFNGDSNRSARGTETYYRAKENGNINLREDMAFAQMVQDALYKQLKALDPGAKNRGIKPDNAGNPNLPGFGVLNDHNLGNDERRDPCRAAYIEAEFITNPSVERLLISGPDAVSNRTLVMGAVANAVLEQMRALRS
ncbi:N-acetylmuramoyl-L-alanine amidase [Rhizobium ruizarguesonis]